MMLLRSILTIFYLLVIGLFLLACGTPADTPTPDLVATQVAVEKAAAATLTAEALAAEVDSAGETPPTEAIAPTPTSTLTPTPESVGDTVQSAAPTETAPPSPLCTVVTGGVNLRTGPGTAYEPPLGAMPQGMTLIPLAFSASGFPDGQWLQVEAQGGDPTGWVSAAPQFVECNVEVTSLPPGIAPPTPTPLPTSTPTDIPPTDTPLPTPTPPLFALVPVDGGQADLEGQIIIPGYTLDELTGPDYEGVTFRDKLVFRVEVYDPSKGSKDGAGIDNVLIIIRDGNKQVHERTERQAGYCVFGGGEPDCNVLHFAEHEQWPDGESIRDREHNVEIRITPKDGELEIWNWRFRIQREK